MELAIGKFGPEPMGFLWAVTSFIGLVRFGHGSIYNIA